MPLMPLEEPHRERLRVIMETAGLLAPDNVVVIGAVERSAARRHAATASRA
jgi:hypothetical protein